MAESESLTRPERFWRPRENDGNEFTFGPGFLEPRGPSWGRIFGIDLVRLAELTDRPFVALLGEPGSGKSTELREDHARALNAAGTEVQLFVDLAELSTRQDVLQAVFGAKEWDAWRTQPAAVLRLDLDSLDECHVDLPTVVQVLLGGFRKVEAPHRLRVRIACRTGVWPVGLESQFEAIFGADQISILELAPLTLEAARQIASEAGVPNVDAFFAEVDRRGVQALAARPVTLQLLCRLFRRDGRLPVTQEALYFQGCLALAEETNASRVASDKIGGLGATERLAVAARLAALSLLTARDRVWIGADLGDRPPSDLRTGELAGGDEPTEQGPVAATEASVREVVTDTALFTGAGRGRFAWAHRTIAEFLAAWFIRSRKLSTSQALQLLLHPLHPDRVVPQLAQVAAWVAGFDPAVFRKIAETDPGVLLGSDVENAATEDRKALVNAILKAAADKKINDADLAWRSGYRRLSHPGLAEQLRPWVADRRGHYLVRRIAIDIAEACRVQQLTDTLIDVALDESDNHHIRDQAAHAVVVIGDREAHRQLRPLLVDPHDRDPDDELKGWALRGLWPGELTAAELFGALTPPKEPSHFGSYAGFLAFDLPKTLRDADLPEGLRWATVTLSGRDPETSWDMGRLTNTLLAKSLRAAGSLQLNQSLATFLWSVARSDGSLASPDRDSSAEVAAAVSELSADRRRELLVALTAEQPAEINRADVRRLLNLGPPIIRAEDLPWMLDRLDKETVADARQVLAKLAAELFRQQHYLPLDPVLDAAARHPELASELHPEMGPPVALDGPEARAGREQVAAMRRLERRTARLASADAGRLAALWQRVDAGLGAVEGGDFDRWCQVVADLAGGLSPRRAPGASLSSWDLSETPGWEAADAPVRGRIVAASEAYLRGRNAAFSDWFEDPGSLNVGAVCGLQALILLRAQGAERFEALPAAVWQSWLSIVWAYPEFSSGDGFEAERQELLARANALVPQDVLQWFGRLLGREARQTYPRDVTRSLDRIWNEGIARQLAEWAREPGRSVVQFGHLLGALLRHGVPEAWNLALAPLRTIGRVPKLPARPRSANVGDSDDARANGPQKRYVGAARVPPRRVGVTLSAVRRKAGKRRTDAPASDRPVWWERALTAALLLADHHPSAAWPVLWRAMTFDPEFGRRFVLHYTHWHNSHEAGPLAASLTEEQVTDLFLWMERRFPRNEDPPRITRAHAVGDRERLAEWREALLRSIAERGTFAAVHELGRAAGVVGDVERFFWLINSCETAALAGSWPRPTPGEILRLADDRAAMLVESEAQLLEVVIASIERYGRRLHGEVPIAFTLWDGDRPKDEESLSDALADHLRSDLGERGVIASREVQIRRTRGTRPGECNDIHIDAVARGDVPGRYKQLSVVVEVKGCWNPEAPTAMKDQLRDRYLLESHCQHGLYLVGWYLCDQWTRSDPRKAATTRILGSNSLEAVRQFFDAQAQALSNDVVRLRSLVLDATLR